MKKVSLDGDVIVIRVVVAGRYEDAFFIRDTDRPSSHNVWKQVSYGEFKEFFRDKTPRYRNGREACAEDMVVKLDPCTGKITDFGLLIFAIHADKGFGTLVVKGERETQFSRVDIADCLHIDDIASMLAEKGLT